MLELIPLTQEHRPAAAALVTQSYRRERAAVPLLGEHDVATVASESMDALCNNGLGVAAMEDGRLMGSLSGFPVQKFFGASDGVYVPVFGHGAVSEDSSRVYRALYAHAAKQWVSKGLLSHVITLFAHEAAVQTWFWMGFGLRCVDGIRDLSLITARQNGLTVRAITADDADVLWPLHREHQSYYHRSPLFMPYHADADAEPLRQWLQQPDHWMWAAFDGSKPISYMHVRHGGETFVCDDPAMRNICSAFTTPAARGSGAATLLLNHVISWMQEQGMQRLGVDYESFNPLGSGFWLKHFTPYTYSLTRRVDERIVGFSPFD